VENVFLIFGGPTVDMSTRQRKRERHEVLAAEKAPPSFLNWSEDAITFSREDHPNRIPNLGQYPSFLNLGLIPSPGRPTTCETVRGVRVRAISGHGCMSGRPATMPPARSTTTKRIDRYKRIAHIP
jgi:hypothetical protein